MSASPPGLDNEVAVEGAGDRRARLLGDTLHGARVGDAVEEQRMDVLGLDLLGEPRQLGRRRLAFVGPAVDRDQRDAAGFRQVLKRIVRGNDAPLCGWDGCHLGPHPRIDRLQLLDIGRRARPIVGRIGGIDPRQGLGNVLHVDHAVLGIEPGVLIDDRRGLLAADRVLLLAGDGFCAAACHHLGAGKARLLEQRLKPRLELVVDIVHENDARPSHDPAVGERRLIEFGIAVRADDGDEIDMVAGDVRDHVAEHAERRDHGWPVGAAQRGSRQHRERRRMRSATMAARIRSIIEQPLSVCQLNYVRPAPIIERP